MPAWCVPPDNEDRRKLRNLSEREWQILYGISEELCTKELGLYLGISPKTVEYHREKLMKKLGAKSVVGLVKFAIRVGMVLPLLVLFAYAEGPLVDVVNTNLTLQWDYPTNYWNTQLGQLQYVTNAIGRKSLTNIWYFSYWTTNIQSATAWTLFSITNNPQAITNSDGSLCHKIPIPSSVQPAAFFTTAGSNMTGLIFFGGPAATPSPLPSGQQNYRLQ